MGFFRFTIFDIFDSDQSGTPQGSEKFFFFQSTVYNNHNNLFPKFMLPEVENI